MALAEWAEVALVVPFGCFSLGILVLVFAFRIWYRLACCTAQAGVLLSLVIVNGAEVYRLVCCFWGEEAQERLVSFYSVPEVMASVVVVYVWLSYVERIFCGQGDVNTNFIWTGAAVVYVSFALLCLGLALTYDETTVAACMKVFAATAMTVTAFGFAFTTAELHTFALNYVPIHLDLINQFMRRTTRFAKCLCSGLAIQALCIFTLVFQGVSCWAASALWLMIPTLLSKVAIYGTLCWQYGRPPLNLLSVQTVATSSPSQQRPLLV